MSTLIDNAKERVAATGDKLKEGLQDSADRVSDKVDEVQADANVKKQEADLKRAEAERDDTKKKNDYKEELRN